MLSWAFGLAVVLASTAAAVLPPGHVHTPVGIMREECVHAVPHGSRVAVNEVLLSAVRNSRLALL